jgi:hypothetical protein
MKFKQNLPERKMIEVDESKEFNEMIKYISNTTELNGFFNSIDWKTYGVDNDGIIYKNENLENNPHLIIPIYESRIIYCWRFTKK